MTRKDILVYLTDSIEENVDNGAEHVDSANDNLEEARNYQVPLFPVFLFVCLFLHQHCRHATRAHKM